jgi:hypothetical protein
MRMAGVRSLWWRCWHRSCNRVRDGLARLAGACNRSTWDAGSASWSGGYAHWRCALRRGHEGVHRFENYVWAGPGSRVVFDPLPVRGLRESAELRGEVLPFRAVTSRRFMTESLRRGRARRRAAERARGELARGGG